MKNYTGYATCGSKYEQTKNLSSTELAKLIRKELKSALPKCKFSVTTDVGSLYCCYNIALMSSPVDVFIKPIEDDYLQVNHFSIERDDRITKAGKDILNTAIKLVKQYHYNDSDPMIDYCNTNFYMHWSIGKYDKPYQTTNISFSK